MRQATFFSIIVPVRDVERYLDDCLWSIRRQSFGDFEILAVDDSSSDRSGTIIDEHAAAEPRLVPIHLLGTPRAGPGPPRNAGIEAARGEYLVFLDGDDMLAPDALRELADHIEANVSPDVVMYDFRFERPCGISSLSNLRRWLPPGNGTSKVFRARDKPVSLRVTWFACNKACRRSFVENHRFRFSYGYHEDSSWSLCALVTAETVSVLPFVCMYYRCCRPQSIMFSSGPRHADFLGQFDRIFGFLREHPELRFPGLEAEVMKRLTLMTQYIGADGSLIPPDMLGEFRARSRRFFDEHRPASYTGPDLRWPPSPWAAAAFAPKVWDG